MTALCEQLKYLRKNKKVSQKVLAEKIGVAQSAIANYESGYRIPNHEILIRLADYFEISLDELVCRVKDKTDWIEISEIFFKSMMDQNYKAAYSLLEHMLDKGVSPKEIYLKVFRYALAKIGWLWEASIITSADEHFLMRQMDMLMDEIYKKGIRINAREGKIIRALGMTAPYEQHTMPVKMIMHLLSFEGVDPFFIGTSVPVEALSKFVRKNEIDVIILSITMQEFGYDLKEYMNAVQKDAFLSQKKFIIGGQGTQSIEILTSNMDITIISEYEEILEVLK